MVSIAKRFSNKVRELYIPSSILKLRNAQEDLLRYFVKSDFESRIVSVRQSDFLNLIELKPNKSAPTTSLNPTTILLTHGYGSGLGFYWANLDYFASKYDRVIAVDWLGMGGSSRPSLANSPFLSPCSSKGGQQPPLQSISFFIDTLQEVILKENITDFVLAGHSLGGYLSARYALKFAADKNIKGLILISPVGISPQPIAEHTIKHAELSFGLKAIKTAWKWNLTPQSIVRAMGPKGYEMVTNALIRRFGKSRWTAKEIEIIAAYLYHISVAEGSGEFALNALLQPIASTTGVGVYAREPLTIALGAIKVPTLMLYGDHDWLYPTELLSYLQTWLETGAQVEVEIVSKAGHHLYLDNPKAFHKKIDMWNSRYFHSQ